MYQARYERFDVRFQQVFECWAPSPSVERYEMSVGIVSWRWTADCIELSGKMREGGNAVAAKRLKSVAPERGGSARHTGHIERLRRDAEGMSTAS